MGSTIILAVVSVVAWVIITVLGAYAAYLENPGEPKGVSIFPGIPVMPALAFAIGYGINYLYTDAGTWIIGAGHLVFIICGIGSLVRMRKKRTQPSASGDEV